MGSWVPFQLLWFRGSFGLCLSGWDPRRGSPSNLCVQDPSVLESSPGGLEHFFPKLFVASCGDAVQDPEPASPDPCEARVAADRPVVIVAPQQHLGY